MKEFDLFIPLTDNEGVPFEPRILHELQNRLLDEFGGLTFFPQPNEGSWRMGDITYRDQIVILRVLTGRVRRARGFLASLKEKLKRDLRQEEILIVERDVKTL